MFSGYRSEREDRGAEAGVSFVLRQQPALRKARCQYVGHKEGTGGG